MNDILLGALIAIFGIVPPVTTALIAWYMGKKSLAETIRYGEQLRSEFQVSSRKIYDDMKEYLVDDFSNTIVGKITGMQGPDVKKIKGELINEGNLIGLPGPIKSTISKGVGNWLSDYLGVPKQAVSDGVMALFNRPSKKHLERDQALVQRYARDMGMELNPVMEQGPIMTE